MQVNDQIREAIQKEIEFALAFKGNAPLESIYRFTLLKIEALLNQKGEPNATEVLPLP